MRYVRPDGYPLDSLLNFVSLTLGRLILIGWFIAAGVMPNFVCYIAPADISHYMNLNLADALIEGMDIDARRRARQCGLFNSSGSEKEQIVFLEHRSLELEIDYHNGCP